MKLSSWKLSRATFVKVMILTVAFALLVAYVVRFRRVAKSIVLRASGGLKFEDENVVDKFMSDAEHEDFWRQFSGAKRLFICVQHFFSSFGLKLPYHAKYLQYRNAIGGHFLMSTDFFVQNMNVNRTVKYVAFYNPYRQPCSNPFSVNFYPGTA